MERDKYISYDQIGNVLCADGTLALPFAELAYIHYAFMNGLYCSLEVPWIRSAS